MARTRRVKVNGRFFVVMAALAIAVAALVILLPRGGSSTLKSESMDVTFTPKVVIIRAESCVSVEKFDKVDYQVNEGATVNAEMPIATVYNWGYTEELTQSLITIQQKIYDKQMQMLEGIEAAELTSINTQITELKQSIKAKVCDDCEGDLLTYERDLKALLSQRAEYLKNSVQPDVELNSLYAEETAKQNQIAEYTSTVNAKMTGVVSFYFDGYEQVLSADKLDVVNADLIGKIISGDTGATVAASDNMLYRLVDATRWYAAFVTPASEGLRLFEGQSYTVSFEGVHEKTYTGVAMAPVIYDGGIVNMLEFSEDIGELLSVRTINATVTAPMTGFAVDAGAVKVKSGACSIVTDSGDVAVNVIAADEDKALVTGALLYDGMKYKK